MKSLGEQPGANDRVDGRNETIFYYNSLRHTQAVRPRQFHGEGSIKNSEVTLWRRPETLKTQEEQRCMTAPTEYSGTKVMEMSRVSKIVKPVGTGTMKTRKVTSAHSLGRRNIHTQGPLHRLQRPRMNLSDIDVAKILSPLANRRARSYLPPARVIRRSRKLPRIRLRQTKKSRVRKTISHPGLQKLAVPARQSVMRIPVSHPVLYQPSTKLQGLQVIQL